jgi:MFS family permease
MSAPLASTAAAGKDGILTPDPERTPGTQTPSESPEVLEKAAIERLGRQRPEVLSSAFVEVAYLATIVLSMMMSEYFISGFFLVLPPVADELGIPESVQTWPAGVINLTTAAFLLPCARFCDRFGARVVFLSGHVWLVIWSIVAGFSINANMLIVSRAMQGLGASAFIPAGLALIAQTYRPGPRKNLVFSIYGAFACVGFYIGIFVGGLSVQFITWSWFFWIGAILSAVVAGSGLLTIPNELGVSNKAIKMDWLGLVTIVPGLILVVFAFTDGGHAPDGWGTPYIYVTLIIGVLFLCAAVYVEGWVAANPLLPAEMFRPKGMRRLVCGLFCCYGVFGLYLYFATF